VEGAFFNLWTKEEKCRNFDGIEDGEIITAEQACGFCVPSRILSSSIKDY